MRFRPARAVRSRDTPDQAPAPGTTLRDELPSACRRFREDERGAAGDEYTHQRKLRVLGERAMARKLARMRRSILFLLVGVGCDPRGPAPRSPTCLLYTSD